MTRRRREVVALVFALSGRVSGALVTLAVVRLVGVGSSTNSLFLAIAVYTLVTSIQASLLETNTVSLHGTGRERETSALLTSGLVFGTVAGLGALLVCFTAGRVLAPLSDALPLIAVMLLSGPLVGMFAVLLGLSVSARAWVRPASASWLRVVTLVALAALLHPHLGSMGVALAFVASDLARLVPFGAVVRRAARDGAHRSTALLRAAFVQLPSCLSGSSNPLIDRIVVAQLAIGSLAVVDLAEKSYALAALTFTQGILPPLFQRWSATAAAADIAGEIRRLALRIIPVAVLVAVLGAGLLAVVAPLLAGPNLSSQLGVFRQATFAYMLGLPAYLSGQVLVRLVILEGRGRLLNLTAIAQVGVNVVADLVLGSAWGITGVALATSLVTWVGWGLIWFLCRHSATGSRVAATLEHRVA